MGTTENKNMSTPTDCPFHDVIVPKTTQSPLDPELVSRVGYLEGALTSLTKDVQAVTTSVGALSDQLNRSVTGIGVEISNLKDSMGAKFDQLTARTDAQISAQATQQSAQHRPNWQAMIAAAGVAITLVLMGVGTLTFWASGQGQQLAELKSAEKEIAKNYSVSEYARGQNDEKTRTHSLQAADLLAQVLDLRKWRLEHAGHNGEFEGRVANKQLINDERIKLLEQHAWETRTAPQK
jgi:hypothetical protein